MKTHHTLLALPLLCAAALTGATQQTAPPSQQPPPAQQTNASANRPRFPQARELSRERQLEILQGTAPASVWENATAWIVKPDGTFEIVKQGSNGFGCLIQTDRFPRCDDAEGVTHLFPEMFMREKLRAEGKSQPEINAAVGEAFLRGTLRAPRAGGLSWMLSDDPQSVVAPHIMYSLPYVRLEYLGYTRADAAELGRLRISPLFTGAADGHVVIMTPHWKKSRPELWAASNTVEKGKRPARVPLLPREREIALALSAAPPVVAAKAAVYVLGPRGYELARAGTNGYSCLVERADPRDLMPRCDGVDSVATVFPVIFLREELRAAGKSAAEIERAVADAYAAGRLRAPRGGGLCYRLSLEASFVSAADNRRAQMRPHVMWSFPYATPEALGYSDARTAGIAELGLAIHARGTPAAHVMVPLPHWKPEAAQAQHQHGATPVN